MASIWQLGWERLARIAPWLVGLSREDDVFTIIGYALLAAVVFQLGRPQRRLSRFLPLLVVAVGFMVLPLQLRSVGFVYPRLLAFLVPALLIAFEPRSRSHGYRAHVSPAVAVAVSGVWLAVFGFRLSEFQREARSFSQLLASMPQGLSVRPVVFDRDCPAFPGVPAFVHFPAYYQVHKGGSQGYSFARYPTAVIRHRRHIEPVMRDGAEWNPQAFDAGRELAHFEYVAVRSRYDRTHELFGDAAEVRLVARHGEWWGYATD